MQTTKTVGEYIFGPGAIARLDTVLGNRPGGGDGGAVYFVDHYFRGSDLVGRLPVGNQDKVVFVDSTDEPTTDGVDALAAEAGDGGGPLPGAIVGIGGGSTLDVAKAVSNLLANGGRAADYQGWDLVPSPGVFKVGVPTLSGTGAEASRTCVMLNRAKNLKLGMNSEHTLFDRLVLDPDLSATVPRDQYFFTGMDTYVHCIESLAGRRRHAVADAYARQALSLCREVFLADDMQAPSMREKLMVASYLGGSALANSLVGVVHPFSAGLSMVFGTRHGLANCIVMNVIDAFYPRQAEEFRRLAEAQDIALPEGLCAGLTEAQEKALYDATMVHEKPLANALGEDFRKVLTPEKVGAVFRRM